MAEAGARVGAGAVPEESQPASWPAPQPGDCAPAQAGGDVPRLLLDHPDFLAVHKPAGWLTHPVLSHGASRAPNLLTYLQEVTGERQLSPPHRLDRETSGILLFSRHTEAARRFALLFRQQLVGKVYTALVYGVPDWTETVLDAPLGPLGLGAANRVVMRQGVVPSGRAAVTAFRWVGSRAGVSRIEARPRTGRMHQIRAHLFHLGLPLVGDKIYGPDPGAFLEFREHGQTPELTRRLGLPRQALHAGRLAFPWAGEQLALHDPWPPDLRRFWDALPDPGP